MGVGTLPNLRVVELATGVAAAYAGRILHDFGAEIIKVEHLGGDPTRELGPFPADNHGRENAGLFAHLNAGKRSCTADFDRHISAQPEVARLIDGADLVLEDVSPGPRAILKRGDIADFEKRLLVVSTSPFGCTGPYASMRSTPLTEWAMGGYMYFCGEPERPPLWVAGHQSDFHAGMQAAFGALAAVHARNRFGVAQCVEVSHWESVLSAHAWLTELWTHCGAVMSRRGSDFLECADGYVYIIRAIFYHPNLFLLIDRPELADDPRWNTPEGWYENTESLWAIVEEWTRTQSKHEVVRLAQELRMAATPVNTVADLVESEQLRDRGWFRTVEMPGGEKTTIPGAAVRVPTAAPPAENALAVPLPGEHQSLLSDAAGGTAARATVRPTVTNPIDGGPLPGPLAGLRVIELTSNWAGPLAGRMLADLGAEVIKVELESRPSARVHYYPGNSPGQFHYDTASYFNHLNRNKYGISLDVSTERGRELFYELIRGADVFVENNSPRVIRNLQITYKELSALNPQLVMLSLSGFGHSGPESEFLAFGTNIETSSGLASVTGYGPGEIHRTGSFYADPIAGSHGAIAVLAALLQRDVAGGTHIDLSLQETAAVFLSEFVMDYVYNNRIAEPCGNADHSRRYVPQGCYPSAGDDMWVALSVPQGAWPAFAEIIGRSSWVSDPSLADAESRALRQPEIDEAIAAWSAPLDNWEATRVLQAAGIPAGPVLPNWQILNDSHLAQRKYFVQVDHPRAGVYPFPGFPWRFGATPGSVRLAAPCFAEHNDHVYRHILSLSDDEIDVLEESGIIGTDPQTPVLRGTL